MLGDKLRRLRGEQLQDDLAKELDINQGRISDFENGHLEFSAEFIIKICSYFRISVREFRKPELTLSLAAFIAEMRNAGILPRNDQSREQKIMHLLKEKQIQELEMENLMLSWELSQYKNASERLEKGGENNIFVMI